MASHTRYGQTIPDGRIHGDDKEHIVQAWSREQESDKRPDSFIPPSFPGFIPPHMQVPSMSSIQQPMLQHTYNYARPRVSTEVEVLQDIATSLRAIQRAVEDISTTARRIENNQILGRQGGQDGK